jgi:putative transposase
MFLIRGFVFSYEAVRDWEAKLTPALAEDLRRRRKGNRAVDRDGALVDVMLNEHRDLAAAKGILRSAKAVTGATPDRSRLTATTRILGRSERARQTCSASDQPLPE